MTALSRLAANQTVNTMNLVRLNLALGANAIFVLLSTVACGGPNDMSFNEAPGHVATRACYGARLG